VIGAASKLRVAAVLALFASSLLHVGAMAISPEFTQNVQVEGSEIAQAATLGSNFADLVKAGDELNPVETEETAEATSPTKTPLTEPVETPRNVTRPITPVTPSTVSPTAFKIEPVQSESLIPLSPVERLDAFNPKLAVVQPPVEKPERLDPKTTETQLEPVKPAETVIPVKKPKPVAKSKVEKPKKMTQRKKTSAGSSKTKSNVNNKSGSQDGKKKAKAASSGKSKSKSSSRNSGNAAASNYPGKVYAKIARTRQKNAGGRGVAHVSFSVTSSGQAARVSVARSSGNARIDRAALAHVKRAAPFPKPPPGARTRFVIPIEFRR